MSSLRQASFYFGEGASSKVVLRQSSDQDHEEATFDELREIEATACHVIFLVDCTGSMGDFINSMPETLVQIYSVLSVLFGDSAEVSIVAYEDYSDGEKNLLRRCVGKTREQTLSFAKSLKAGGGGDVPEATKTALNAVLKIIRQSSVPSSQTIVFHYTDAVCHHPSNSESQGVHSNGAREQSLLELSKNGDAPSSQLSSASGWPSTALSTSHTVGFDWVKICSEFRKQEIRAFSFTPRSYYRVQEAFPFLAMLGEMIALERTTPRDISKVTMDIVLQLMGQATDAGGGGGGDVEDGEEKEGDGDRTEICTRLVFSPFCPPLVDHNVSKEEWEDGGRPSGF